MFRRSGTGGPWKPAAALLQQTHPCNRPSRRGGAAALGQGREPGNDGGTEGRGEGGREGEEGEAGREREGRAAGAAPGSPVPRRPVPTQAQAAPPRAEAFKAP